MLDVILAPGFLDQVCTRAALLDELLDSLVADAPDIFAQRRGLGLLIGLRCVPAVVMCRVPRKMKACCV